MEVDQFSPITMRSPPSPVSPNRDTDSLSRKKRKQSDINLNQANSNSSELDNYIPAGVILLSHYIVTDKEEEEDEEEGADWLVLGTSNLNLKLTAVGEYQDVGLLPTPPASPDKGKQKAYSQDDPNLKAPLLLPQFPSELLSSKEDELKLINTILKLQNRGILVAEVNQFSTLSSVVIRIYLIPQDVLYKDQNSTNFEDFATGTANLVFEVLNEVSLNADAWNGLIGSETKIVPRLMEEDTRSLLEIYHSIPSPSFNPGSIDGLECSQSIKKRLKNVLLEDIVGMKTVLYQYQKAAVAKMLGKELAPQSLPDPRFSQYSSVDSRIIYFISPHGKVLINPPRFEEPRSGLLAEEMGAGKTAIALALILSTLGEFPILSSTSSKYLDGSICSTPSIVLTEISKKFPFKKYREEVSRLSPRLPERLIGAEVSMTQKEIDEEERARANQHAKITLDSTIIKPLPSLQNLMINLSRTSSAIDPNSKALSVPLLKKKLNDNPPFYYVHPSKYQQNSRGGRTKTFLPVKIYITSCTLVVVPPLLLKQWVAEIEKHCKEGVLSIKKSRVLVLKDVRNKFPASPEEYGEYDLILMSTSRFTSAAEEIVGKGESSYLREVHFKRLLVDEGHILGNSNPSLVKKLASEILAQSKWSLTGTPSRNLVGKSESTTSNDSIEGGEKEDFDKLANIFSIFMQHSAYRSPKSFGEYYSASKFKNRQQLQSLLNSAVIRSQPEVRELDYVLPSLTTTVVRLEMEEAERLTYNTLVAMFVANSVTSERTDRDYFFNRNPEAKALLNILAENFTASSTFFASASFLADIEHLLRVCKTFFVTSEDDANDGVLGELKEKYDWSIEDEYALRLAIEVNEEALANQEWKLAANSLAPFIEITGLSKNLSEYFGALDKGKNKNGNRTVIPIQSLASLKAAVRFLRSGATSDSTSSSTILDGEEFEEEIITFETKRRWKVNNPEAAKLEEEQEKLNGQKKKKKKKSAALDPIPIPIDSTLLNIQLGPTSSSKINYIVSRLLAEPEEKFLIFCSSLPDLLLASISEVFDLINIKHVIFAGGVKHYKGSEDLGSKAIRFNTSPPSSCQVALLSVSYAARGLQLESASRIIFLEPIWQKDLELQARARAHRLGQFKEVRVEILIIGDSFEDTMYLRRETLNSSGRKSSTTKQPQADSDLQKVLQESHYLKPKSSSSPTTPSTPSTTFSSSNGSSSSGSLVLSPLFSPLGLNLSSSSSSNSSTNINNEKSSPTRIPLFINPPSSSIINSTSTSTSTPTLTSGSNKKRKRT